MYPILLCSVLLCVCCLQMDVWHLYNAMKLRGIKPLSRSVVDTTADSSTYQTNLTCTRLKPFL